jgi:MoaA/NifB/PqqE/SkfB family radical SAM enzyme
MRARAVFPAWGRILMGYRPFLSVEITNECPLQCPGCYVFEPGRLRSASTIRELKEWHGEKLIEGVLWLGGLLRLSDVFAVSQSIGRRFNKR